MSLQEQRNKAKEQNKHNKAFLEGFQNYLGDSWKVIYKSTTEKWGTTRIRKMTLRVECGLFGVIFRIPNLDTVQNFELHTFELVLKHFNNCDDPVRKTFLKKFNEYKDVMLLKNKLENELKEGKPRERKMKI
ncbi:MAG: hypothetical protein PHW29_04345 [Flavobacterium sp.]|nr:hypothetical protein [Flavobacterium sp.]